MSWLSVTAATSRASANCWKNRKEARSVGSASVRWISPKKRFWPFLKLAKGVEFSVVGQFGGFHSHSCKNARTCHSEARKREVEACSTRNPERSRRGEPAAEILSVAK